MEAADRLSPTMRNRLRQRNFRPDAVYVEPVAKLVREAILEQKHRQQRIIAGLGTKPTGRNEHRLHRASVRDV